MRVQDYLRLIFKINHGFNLPRYLRDMVSLRTSVKDLRGTYRHEIPLYIQRHMGFIPLDNLLPKDGMIQLMSQCAILIIYSYFKCPQCFL